MNEIILAWMLIVSSPIDQENMPFFESKLDCMEAARVYNKIEKKQDAYCSPIEVEIIRERNA
jgi:hypothetical protein